MTERKAAIAEEQRAVDHAYTCYERKFQNNRDAFRSTRRELTDAHAGTAFITDVAPEIRFESDLGGEALVIARVDDMEDGKPKTWYIGRRPVRDEDHDAFVIDWQTPQAIDWMLRRPDDPGKMTLRRLLRCEADRVRDFRDEIRIVAAPSAQRAFTASALAAGEPLPPEPDTAPGPPSIEGLKDFLLEDLERARDGRMRDIVETIQRDQLLLVSDDRKGVLIVQGGPGTGKTAVGLHRISWLLFNERFKTGDVLVVGPHRRFLDYVRGVLPRLGTRDVTAVELDRLWDAPRGVDPLPARLVKSDARMAEVLRRAVDALPHHRMNTKLRGKRLRVQLRGAGHRCRGPSSSNSRKVMTAPRAPRSRTRPVAADSPPAWSITSCTRTPVKGRAALARTCAAASPGTPGGRAREDHLARCHRRARPARPAR